MKRRGSNRGFRVCPPGWGGTACFFLVGKRNGGPCNKLRGKGFPCVPLRMGEAPPVCRGFLDISSASASQWKMLTRPSFEVERTHHNIPRAFLRPDCRMQTPASPKEGHSRSRHRTFSFGPRLARHSAVIAEAVALELCIVRIAQLLRSESQ